MIVTAIDLSHGLEGILNSLMTQGAALGWTLIKAFLVFIVGRLLINLVNKLIKRVLLKRDIDPSVKTFVGSLVNVVLTILLIISVVGALGVQTTSFAACLLYTSRQDIRRSRFPVTSTGMLGLSGNERR